MRLAVAPRALFAPVLCSVVWLTGCVPNAGTDQTIAQYQEATDELGTAAGTLFAHANTVEQNGYIDKQTFSHQPLSPIEIKDQAIFSREGLTVRAQAIAALSAYTVALAGIASGEPETRISADTATAKTDLAGLATDLQTALAKDNADAANLDLSGPVTAATLAAGDLIQMVERRHGRAELQASLRKNDPSIKALFDLVAADAERVYTRQKLTTDDRGVLLYGRYAAAIRQGKPDDGSLLDLADRIKHFRRQAALLESSDPASAFAAWSAAHDELVSALLGEGTTQARKKSLRELVLSVQVFASEVKPLSANLKILDQDL